MSQRDRPFIHLPAWINGKGPFDLILDTGAGISMLREDLASRIGIQVTGEKEAQGAAGRKMKVQLGNANRFRIGECEAEDIQVGIMKDLPRCVGGEGIAGVNFLRNWTVEIDYPQDELIFSSSVEKRHGTRMDARFVPFRHVKEERPLLLVNAVVNEKTQYSFFFDTGASQTVVSPDIARNEGIESIKTDPLVGVGGSVHGSVAVLQSLAMGDTRLRNVRVAISDIFSELSNAAGIRADGIIGYNFLRRYKVIIDFPQLRIGFEHGTNESPVSKKKRNRPVQTSLQSII